MEIGDRFKAADRAAWRAWLVDHHKQANDIWLISDKRDEVPTVRYLDAVEEALCFGWVDSISKRVSEFESAQRFSPRRPRSNWTELNKARARRLIRLGLMTESGRQFLPDLDAPFAVASDIKQALRDRNAWDFYAALPELYRRVRVGYIEEMRKRPAEFEMRLNNFLEKTAAGKLYGNWNDGGRLNDDPDQPG
ncbi:MAG: YdeI/OmpD-associated family protein [Pseudomonadota bacterium]